MKRTAKIFFLLIGLCGLLSSINAAPGDLDLTFSGDGKLVQGIGVGGYDIIRGTVVLADGKILFFYKRTEKAKTFKLEFALLPLLFALGGAGIAGVWAIIRLGNFRNYWMIALYLTIGGLIFGFGVALHHRFMPTGELRKTSEI